MYIYTYIRFILHCGVFSVGRGVSDMYLLYLSMVGLWLTYVARLIYIYFTCFFNGRVGTSVPYPKKLHTYEPSRQLYLCLFVTASERVSSLRLPDTYSDTIVIIVVMSTPRARKLAVYMSNLDGT